MNTWDMFFLFPGMFIFVFLVYWVPNRQRTVPGKSRVSVLEPCSLILNFSFWCQYLFFNFLRVECRANGRGDAFGASEWGVPGHCRVLRSRLVPRPAGLPRQGM